MKAVVAALAVNLGIAVTKFAAFLITGSASMLAESVHSVADTGNELLLIIGSGRSRRARTELHPFGFGRERYFYGFVVAVLLFTVGGVFSVYEGVHKILAPEPVHDAIVAFVVLAICVVLESLSLRTAVREANAERLGRSWGSFVHATKSPELPVVLMEDLAALLGLLFAFTGVLLSVTTGSGVWDGAGSVAIGVLLVGAAFIVGYEMKSLLIGEAASGEVSASIVAAIEDGPEGLPVIHLRTSHVGPDSLLVVAKVAVPAALAAAALASRIDAAEKRVREAVPIAETIYLEPDIYEPGREDVADPSIQAVRRSRVNRRPDARHPDPRRAAGSEQDTGSLGRRLTRARLGRGPRRGRAARAPSRSPEPGRACQARARSAGRGRRPSRGPKAR